MLNALPLLPSLQFRDLRAQSDQVIDPKPGAPSGGPRKQILLRETGPRREHGAQFAFGIEVHHPVFAPGYFARHENELCSAPGVKGVRDLKSNCL